MAAQSASIPDDIAAMSFEDALAALEEIVGRLESGEASLEESIDIYSRGALLKRHCEEKLKTAQARIDKIAVSPAGQVEGSQPLDME